MKNFGTAVKKKRTKEGISQYKLAEITGVSRHLISHWERKKTKTISKKVLKSFVKVGWGDEQFWSQFLHKKRKQRRCCVHRCFGWRVSKKMCETHYREILKYGKIRHKKEKRASKGSGHLDKSGYIRVTRKDRTQTFQHRQVMEEFLGRRLTRTEYVHHKNGIRADNRLDNLELWTRAHPSGQRVSDKLKWAKEFIKEYDNLLMQ